MNENLLSLLFQGTYLKSTSAVSAKEHEIYARYKKVRNEITFEKRNTKAQYFTERLTQKPGGRGYSLI